LPDTPEGATSPETPTTEPVSVPVAEVRADEASEVPAGPAQVGGIPEDSQLAVEPVVQPSSGSKVPQVIPRSDVAALTPEQAQSHGPTNLPNPSLMERLREKLNLNIGTPPPPIPEAQPLPDATTPNQVSEPSAS